MCTGPTCIKPPARDCDRTCTQSTLRTTARRWRKLKLFETDMVFGARKQFPGDVTECFLSSPPPPPLILFMFCQTEISTNKDDSWWQQHAAPLTSIICKKNKQHFTWRVSRCGIDAMEFTSSSQPDSNAGWKLTRIISLCSRSSQCCTPAGVPKPCFLLLLLWFYGYFFLHI